MFSTQARTRLLQPGSLATDSGRAFAYPPQISRRTPSHAPEESQELLRKGPEEVSLGNKKGGEGMSRSDRLAAWITAVGTIALIVLGITALCL